MSPKVLLVDDLPDVLDSYEDILRGGGYRLGRAASPGEALRLLQTEGPWDVVLLDERLNGPGGGESATSLIVQIVGRFPDAQVLVVTAYGRKDLVRAALGAGAWDYLQKDEFLELLLPTKVRQASSVAVGKRLARTSSADVEASLRAAWAASQAATDRNEKGAKLEQTMRLLFHTMPGFEHVRTNWRSDVEEIDLVVRNESNDEFLRREGPLWLIECKNWSRPVDPQAVTSFRSKMRDRYQRTQLGLFVAAGGFTSNVEPVLLRQSSEKELVVVVDGAQLDDWIRSADRVAWLKTLIEDAILRAGYS